MIASVRSRSASACAVLAMASSIAAGQVSLRGRDVPPWLSGEVVAVMPDGVVIQPPATSPVIVGWDRVRDVEGVLAEEAAPFLDVAERLWRARVRIERGDVFAAEPLLEEPFEYYDGRVGPTAAMVAEALLRARLRRGAQIGAVRPWIALLAATEGGGRVDGVQPVYMDWSARAGLGDVMDGPAGLVPALPPIWFDWPAVVSFASAAGVSRGGDAALSGSAALWALYGHAARFECGWRDPFPRVDGSSRAVSIVADIVLARAGSAAERDRARGRLRGALNEPMEPWLEAWRRVGLGRSLTIEEDPELRLLGVAELLMVPARLSSSHPYLAGMALAESSLVLREMGLTAGAQTLRDELFVTYPDHPATTWHRMRDGGRADPRRGNVRHEMSDPRSAIGGSRMGG